uniref:CAZy families GH2 protein n=1 Tax=uncultured Geobacillus sp. TaxID=228952 RepID=A0A060CE17_9BACL|nr:CAZy families GH2 protein [uncultured Geobacillus sp.]
MSAQTSELQLNSNWKFQSMDNPKEFLPAKVPGTVHTDLFENGLIPHPFVGNNELELQWISDERWQYVLEFELTKNN